MTEIQATVRDSRLDFVPGLAPSCAQSRRRVEETAADAPMGLVILLAATVLYLLVELAFNSRLLDVSGGRPGLGELQAMASWGRVLSGVALTLAIWGWIVAPLAPFGGGMLAGGLVISAALSFGLAAAGEYRLLDGLIDGAGALRRQSALELRVLSDAVADGAVRIEGVDLSAETLASPEGKCFVALLPVLAQPAGDAVDRGLLTDTLRGVVERRVGGAAALYDRAFIPSVRMLRDSFNRYVLAQQAMLDSLRRAPADATGAWARWLAAGGNDGGTAPASSAHAMMARSPAGRPHEDEAGFKTAYANGLREAAQAVFAREGRMIAGAPLPSGLDWNAFIALPGVQARWRAALGVPDGVVLAPGMGIEAFRNGVYATVIAADVDRELAALENPPLDLAARQAREAAENAALDALVIPPLAMGFSLMGLLFHSYRLVRLTGRLIAPAKRGQRLSALVLVAALAGSAVMVPNRVTASQAFHSGEQRLSRQFGGLAALGIRWITQLQPVLYPAGRWVRETAMLGYDFGYGVIGERAGSYGRAGAGAAEVWLAGRRD